MGEHDHRTREQRLADAAVEFFTAGKPATVQVTATVDTLVAAAGAAGGEMEFSMPLPSATVQRLACDSSVMRVLFEADSLPVDVGRSRRLVDSGLRKAHHRMVHEGGWKLIKVEGKIVSIAPTVTFGLPRGPD